MNKLIIAVVQNDDADAVVDALLEAGYRATRLASTGGFLRKGNTTLLIGASDDQIDNVLEILRKNAISAPARDEAAVSGVPQAAATVFVLDLEDYERF